MMKAIQGKINDFTKFDKSAWEVVRFGDMAFNISERVEPGDTDAEIYVGLEHLDSDSIHIRRKGKPSDVKGTKLRVYAGDIIFGKRRAYQRKAAIADFNGICSAHAMVLRANPEKIEPSLFPFFIHSDAFMNRAVEISEGSLSPTIKWKILAEQEFSLPPRNVQMKFAELLWVIDEIEEKILIAESNISTIFDLLLRNISIPNKKCKLSKLRDVIELNYGKGLKESDRIDGDYPVVGSSGICGSHNKFLVEGPGIVVGRKGSAGEITWIANSYWPIDTTYLVTLIDIKKTDLRYIYYLLRFMNLRQYSISTAIPGLNKEDVLELPVRMPTIELQIEIRKKLDSVLEYKSETQNYFKLTRQLRQSIISSYF